MSEDDILSKYKIPLFNGANHKEWSTKMALALQIKLMWKYCDPKLLTKLTGSSSSTKKDDPEERMKCRALLLLPAAEIVACASELFALSMEDGMPMEDYLAKYEVLNKRLNDQGVGLAPSMLTACMLARVSNYYKPVATTLEALATKTDPLNWDKAKILLISQASKRNTLDDGGVKTTNYTSGRGSVAGRMVCSACGNPRHTKENCWKVHPEKRKVWLESQLKKASVAVKGRDSKPEEEGGEQEAGGFAWMAATPVISKRSEWWVDCGASGHMSPFSDLFACYQPYDKPKYVRMGDGRPHRALGKGSIRITKHNGLEEVLHNVDYVPELKQNLFSSGIMTGKGFQISAVSTGGL
jgi:hypothetical protein